MTHKILPAQFKLAAFATRRWSVTTNDGETLEDTLAPSYWTHVAGKLTPNDIIEVHAVDGSYYAELYVRSVSRLEASVAVLAKYEFNQTDAPAFDADYEVKWRGPARRWGVIRVKDKAVVRDGFQTQDLAAMFLMDYRRSVAA